MSHEYFDLLDCAKLLGTDRDGIRRLIESGALVGIAHSHGVVVEKESVIRHLELQREVGK